MTYKDLGDAMFDYVVLESSGGTSDTPSPRTKARAAGVINGALREIRDLRRNLFKARHGWKISAPQSVTFTVPGGNPYAVQTLSPAAPNSGCTLRTGALEVDVHLAANALDSNYTSDIAYPGPYVAGIGGTLYHDAILIHRGKDRGTLDDQFESVVGDVRFNRRPLVLAKNVEEVERRLATSTGDYGAVTGRARLSRLPIGDPAYCWPELYTVDGNQTELRLRIAPMPSGAGTLEASVMRLPVELTSADLDLNTKTFGLPGNMDVNVLLPFVLKRWIATPFVSLRPDQSAEITRQYEHAYKTLMAWRPMNSKSAMAVATNQ